MISIDELMKEIQVNTQEAFSYVKYFDFLRQRGTKSTWRHFNIRFFNLSVAYLGKGYYSALMTVREVVEYADIDGIEAYTWLKGWIFWKDKKGLWWVIVDGDTEPFKVFKLKYKEIKTKMKR